MRHQFHNLPTLAQIELRLYGPQLPPASVVLLDAHFGDLLEEGVDAEGVPVDEDAVEDNAQTENVAFLVLYPAFGVVAHVGLQAGGDVDIRELDV